MKHLKNLNEKLIKPKNDLSEAPTYSDVIADSLLYGTNQDGASSIKTYKLANKIINAGDEIDLEDADFDLMKSVVNGNPRKYYTWCHSQAMEKILEWETGLN